MIIVYDKDKNEFRAYGDAVIASSGTGFPVELLRFTKSLPYEDKRFIVGHCNLVRGKKRGENPDWEDNFAQG